VALYKNKYRVESARLKEWDYSIPRWYYVTVCTKKKKHFFGRVINGEMRLNKLGKAVKSYFEDIPAHYKSVEIDCYVIMPNHIHGIIIINPSVETGHAPSLQHKPSLGNVVGSFKSAVTKHARKPGHQSFS